MSKSRQINEKLFKFEKEGDNVQGIVTKVSKHTFEDTKSTVNVYHMRTDDGKRIQFICGTPTDNSIDYMDIEGVHLSFYYNGKVQLEKGRSMNDFTVSQIDDDETDNQE